MPALFNYRRQLEHGTKNATVARLTVQVANRLRSLFLKSAFFGAKLVLHSG